MTMQPWFPAAKLGIFIHWGIYAVDGVAESWSLYHGTVSHDDYYGQLERFTGTRYDPGEWAALFARAGAGYAVLTARHHDGVALWDCAEPGRTVGRDLIGPYAEALRRHGLKVGLYYSHSDWGHPDYAWSGDDDPVAWARYLEYRDNQVGELIDRYRPDLLWFDGEWERTEEQWQLGRLARLIADRAPDTVLNGRMLSYGDYATPEQGLPVVAPDGPWELCLTINDSWGYQPQDRNYKSLRQLVHYFCDTIGLGGNLLLDVGPRADGTIPPEQVYRLEALGAWIARHHEAVHGTTAGLPAGYFFGPTTLSADRRTIYLFVSGGLRESVVVKGLRTPVRRARAVATGSELSHRVTGGHGPIPGLTWIGAPPATELDPYMTVLAVELDGELDLSA
jgi:alpha-L-fucosidase